MAKTLASLAAEYSDKQFLWLSIANDPFALEDRNKTKEEAFLLASYFEGKFDGVVEAGYITN